MIEASTKYFVDNAAKLISVASATILSLAVSFDVGFFYGIDIDIFTFFSLSEHILFSIQWLPLSLVLFFVGVIVTASIWFQATLPMKFAKNLIFIRYRYAVALASFSICVIFLYYVYTKYELVNFVIVFTYATICLIVAEVVVSPRVSYATKATIVAMSVYILVLGAAFGLGFGFGWFRSHENNRFNDKIITKDGEELGRIIRAGEKGILYLSAPNNKKVFIKWEELKEVILRDIGNENAQRLDK
jgi:hypothetical protein